MTHIFFSPHHCRFITRDELQAALKEHGIADAEAIKEIIAEVDIDNVSYSLVSIQKPNDYSFEHH